MQTSFYNSGSWVTANYIATYVTSSWQEVKGMWEYRTDSGSWIQIYDNAPGPVASVHVFPDSPDPYPTTLGVNQTFTATAYDSHGRQVTTETFTWTVSGFHCTIGSTTGILHTTAGATGGTVTATGASNSTQGTRDFTVS